MANFRQVHTKIWKDDWFLDLQAEHKLFFIYLFTNEMASISGIYELSQRVMSFESGLTQKEIAAAFEEFQKAGKAYYGDGVVWIVNLRKYHETASPKLQDRITKDVVAVRDCPIKDSYCKAYGIDRVSVKSDGVSIPPYTYKSKSTCKSKSTEAPEKQKTTIPESLNTPAFLSKWAEWETHRREIRKPLKPTTKAAQLKKAAQYQPEQAIWVINQSIENGWTGLFWDKLAERSSNGRLGHKEAAAKVVGEF